jgi:hypothetical protein
MKRFDLVIGGISVCLLAACSPSPPEQVSAPQPAWPHDEQQIGPTGLPASADVVEARWDSRAPLPERRTEVSVAADGEHVYLAGGFGPPETGDQATAPRGLWRYSPVADEWTRMTDIPEGVNHAALVHHGGRLFLVGGFREASFQPIDNVRIYEIASDSWSDGAPMPTPRGAMAFTVHAGRIHLIGGNAPDEHAVHDHEGASITDDRSVNVHEAYDPATDQWTRLAPMPTPRNHLTAVSLNGRVHALVGRADGDFELTTHEIYDPATDSWRSGPPVPTGRSGVAAVTLGNHLYLFGGETFGDDQRTFGEAERFDARQNRWEALPPMPTPRHGLGAAAVGRSIYVISGGPSPGFAFSDATERLTIPER